MNRMTLLLASATFVALAAAGCYVFPDPPPDWVGDFTVENVLARAEHALAPPRTEEEKKDEDLDPNNPPRLPPRQVKDMVASLDVTRYPSPGVIEKRTMLVKWRRGGTWSVDLRGEGIDPVRFIGEGTGAVEVLNGAVVRTDVSLDEIGVRHFLRCMFAVPYFRSDSGGPAEIEESVALNDGAHAINIRKYDDRGLKWILSIDSATSRPSRLREWMFVAEEEGRSRDTYFRDYATDRAGYLYPKELHTYDGRTLIQESVVRNLDWDTGLREADFAIPRGGPTTGAAVDRWPTDR